MTLPLGQDGSVREEGAWLGPELVGCLAEMRMLLTLEALGDFNIRRIGSVQFLVGNIGEVVGVVVDDGLL
jgi:hypothetical protein